MKDNLQVKKLAKHSSIYAAGALLRQLTGFIMLPVYTNYLTPEDYGVVGILTFSLALVEIFFGARLMAAVPRYYFSEKDLKERNAVISTALTLTVIVSLMTTIVLIGLKQPASLLLFGSPGFSTIVAIFSVLLVTQALENYGMGFLRIKQKPFTFIIVSVLKLATQLSLNIYLIVYLDQGIFGVAISTVASSLLFAICLTIYLLINNGAAFRKNTAVIMVKYCWPLWVGAIAGLYIGSANRVFIRNYSSLEEVGLFELAAKFSMILSALIWQPFAQYWQVERFRLVEQEGHRETFRIVTLWVGTVLITGGLAISIFSGSIIGIMAAPAFHSASAAVPFLVTASLFGTLGVYSNFGFLLREKTAFISKNTYMTAAVATVFYFILIPAYGFVGAAIALMIARIVQFFTIHYSSKAHYDVQLKLPILAAQLGIALVGFLLAENFVRSDDLYYQIVLKLFVLIALSSAIFLTALVDKQSRKLVKAFVSSKLTKRGSSL
ncbi:MAG: O-antigen/teichoic acid export membrane protein [Candidatus Azotimanducaceae bacterium]|jgi:O-antigen/teichoic acid export membrane protein